MEATSDLTLVHNAINRIKVERDKINSEVSRIDKEVNDHYHVLELLELNAAEMVKIASSLRGLLKRRRKLKEQQILITNFLSMNVDSIKDPILAPQNASVREAKYRAEAFLSYERILGRKKSVKINQLAS